MRRFFGKEHWIGISLFLALYDIVVVAMSYFLALWLRFDCRYSEIPAEYLSAWKHFTPIYIVLAILCFYLLRLYKSIWRFASYSELLRTIIASIITTIIHTVGITAMMRLLFDTFTMRRMPISYYIIGAIIQFCLILGARFAYRFILMIKAEARIGKPKGECANVMVIGAGSAGQMIVRDINSAVEVGDRVVCVIDDNKNKQGRYIDGVPVVGGREHILEAADKYHIQKIFLAVPSASMAERRDILAICQETGCELKNLPGMYQLVNGDVSVSNLKKVSIEDLLGRDPIQVDMNEVFDFLHGKTVLVTGGGGSIGSELCRQVADHHPKRLIIFDIYENNAYSIQLELKEKHPELDLVTLIGSVRDSRKMFQVFEQYNPDVVYHAAAHKHVPLMEDSPCEAIKNNAIGTYKTAYAAMVHGCKRFVLISTDKAVNPTNIMGASKRLCEMIIQSFDAKIKEGKAAEIPQLFTHYTKTRGGKEKLDLMANAEFFRNIKTEFVAVRFGNVLGSNGSVIPIFKKQIEKGGPVTVTHPDIIRYFMTIPEAVSLVLLAGTNARGGEIFVLDMGSPVKIDTLARNLIRLSGLKPDEDIKIEYTGLRPGEKLYEEKLMAEEGLEKTENEKIHIGRPLKFDINRFLDDLDDLMDAAYANSRDIKRLVAGMVNTYHQEGVDAIRSETYRLLMDEVGEGKVEGMVGEDVR
ncbi:MAG: polysaccharide biosynthesis protein [Lachnospiraceae bacterium]|nr:polysaccharide biosynthesis protein [Lachnospiraceae bacterium]